MASKNMQERFSLVVCGLLSDTNFHLAKCCAQDLHAKAPSTFSPPEIKGMLEFEWDIYVEEKKCELRGEMWVFDDKAIAFVNGNLIGGPKQFLEWAEQEHNYENFRPLALYDTLAEKAYKSYMNDTKHDFVYMDISIEEKPVGRLVFELFSDILPWTCENFRALCTGEMGDSKHSEHRLQYKGSIFHRIVKNGWVQGGDIWMKRGDGGESVYDDTPVPGLFEDENFALTHDKRGILGMANKGRATNGSQFYVTLQPAKWMDTKYVAFGQVIEGTSTLKAIEAQDTMNERPMKEVLITDAGVLTFTF